MLALLALLACTGPDRVPRPTETLFSVAETETWHLSGLSAPAYVVRTAGNVPYLYAANREDLARVQGFVIGRDRFFEVDMGRRLALGEVSALLGDAALETDLESRAIGMTHVADRIVANLTPEQAAWFDAFAAGLNDYIEAVRDGALPPPSELEVAAPLLGKESAVELMAPFDRRGVAGFAATVIYNLGYETGDVGLNEGYAALEGLFDDAAYGELREAGAYDDVWAHVRPVKLVASAYGWGLETADGGQTRARARRPVARALPAPLRDRLLRRLDRIEARLGHDHHNGGWGSNAWAVMGAHTTDGRALLAGDGHLPLSVPSLFYPIGFDTELLGGGDTTQVGLVIPGLPILAVGTNGRVAWSQTQLMGDVTDWYREQLTLDDAGLPSASLYQGEWQPLSRVDETFDIAEVPLLDSVGRTETWSRWVTADGRWLADVEGRDATPDEVLAAGESLINVMGSWVVPGDADGDGVITAVSFDYGGLDDMNPLQSVDAFGHADDVHELREAGRGLVAYSQNIVAADRDGGVLYMPYQATPCRSHYPRDEAGRFADGGVPWLLLDGTTVGGFTIPTVDGVVDESQAARPGACVVPFEDWPGAYNPARGYVQTANNDVGGITLDDDMDNEPWYIGGPWAEGYRADSIDGVLAAEASAKSASLSSMQALQAHTTSRLGEQFLPVLLDAITAARDAAGGDPDKDTPDARLADLYAADADAIDEVEARLLAWQSGGFRTPSGVATFYDTPTDQDAEDAVATMIFNAWFSRFYAGVWDDEGLPYIWRGGSATGKLRTLTLMIDGRGEGNPGGLASFNEETGESIFFDVLGTDAVETSDEVAVDALADALTFLRSDPTGDGEGGFGTDDMNAWLWGLRHRVHFDSVLGEFLGDDPTFAPLFAQFSITTSTLPLDDGIVAGDPRYGLDSFPRPGDPFAVDAANPGFSGTSFTYGSGPVFRMAIALGPDGPEGHNVIPGGSSGLVDSPYFADQAALWLGNDTLPMLWGVDQVAASALGRETYLP